MSSAETVSQTTAAQASAERIAQLKRLQRRVGGLRSTLPVSTTDDAPPTSYATPSYAPSSNRNMQSYQSAGADESYAEPEYSTHVSDRPRMSRAAAAPVHDVPEARPSNSDANIRMAAVIGSLLSYIRSAETSPEAFIDPSYFQNGQVFSFVKNGLCYVDEPYILTHV